jgi:hypothetical protein
MISFYDMQQSLVLFINQGWSHHEALEAAEMQESLVWDCVPSCVDSVTLPGVALVRTSKNMVARAFGHTSPGHPWQADDLLRCATKIDIYASFKLKFVFTKWRHNDAGRPCVFASTGTRERADLGS